MIRFIKENLYDSVTMFVNQIAMMIFALMLHFSVYVLVDKNGISATLCDTLMVGTSVLSILFYCYLLYYKCYEMGQKDGIKIEAKRLKYNRWKCFFISLIANIPNLLLGLAELIGKLFINGVSLMQPISEEISTNLTNTWAIDLYSVAHTLSRFLQAMFMGIGDVFFSGVGFFDLLTPLLPILVCTLSYQLGVRRCNCGAKGKSKKGKAKSDKQSENKASRYQ